MVLLNTSASAHYENLFGILNSFPLWVMVALGFLIGGVLLAVMIVKGIARKEGYVAWVLMSFIVASTMAGIGVAAIGTSRDHTLPERINANLGQKYDGAKLAPKTDLPKDDDALAKPFKYKLEFPNGTTGEYMIRFDRATSEPFTVDQPAPPTPEQLQQYDH